MAQSLMRQKDPSAPSSFDTGVNLWPAICILGVAELEFRRRSRMIARWAGRTRMWVMGIPQEQADRIEALRGLVERLSAPELTLTEAKALRGSLSDLLEPAEKRGRPDPMGGASTLIPPLDRGVGGLPDVWSPETSMRVAS